MMNTNNPTYEELIQRNKALEQELQSEKVFRKSFEIAMVGIAHVSPEGNILRVNNEFCKMIGYTAEELKKLNYQDISFPEDLPDEKKYVKKILNNELNNYEFEKRYIHKNGQIIWARLIISVVRKPDGSVDHSIANIVDITDRKKMETSLRDSKARYEQLFKNSRDGYVVVNTNQQIIDANPSFCEMLGYTLEELKALKNFYDITPAKWQQWEQDEIWEKKLLKTGFSGIYEKEYIRKDGTVFPVQLQSYAVFDKNDLSYLWGVARDISSQKSAEKKQQQTIDRLNLAMESANEGAWEWNYTTGLVTFNDHALKMLGYDTSAGTMEADFWTGQVHAEDRNQMIEKYDAFLKGESSKYEAEFRIKSQQGAYKWVKSTARILDKDENGNPLLVVGIHRDITAEKETQRKLEENETKYRRVFEGAGDAIIVTDKKTKVLDVNPAFTEITGIAPEEVIGKTGFTLARKFASAKVLPQLFSSIKDMVKGKKVVISNFRFNDKYLEISSKASEKQNLYVAILRDITENQVASQAQSESEANLNSVIESTPDAIWSVDRDYKILTINTKFQNDFEFVYGKKLEPGVKITDFVSPEEKEKWINRYKKVFKGQTVSEQEVYEIQGQKNYFEIRLYPITEKQIVTGATVISSDITHLIKNEAKLEELNNKFSLAADSAAIGVWEYNLKTSELIWDEWMFKLYGVSPKKFSRAYDAWKNGLHPEDQKAAENELNLAIEGRKKFDTTFRIITPKGQIKYIKANATVVKNEDGETEKIIGTNYDITRQKKAEAELKRSESNYRMLVENQNDLVVKVDHEGKFLFVSPSYCRMFGKTAKELLGKAFIPLVHPDDRAITEEAMKMLYQPPHQAYMEQRAMTTDGWKWFGWEDKAVLDENGEVKEIVGVGREITEQKNAEQARIESEEKFKILFEAAPDAYYLNDFKGRFIDGNKKAEELLGYKKEELLGKDFSTLNILSKREIPRALKSLALNVAGQKTGPDEFHLIRKDGRKIPVEIQTQPVKMAGKKVVLGIARDITKRIENEKALRESEERYRNLIETASDAIFMISANGKLLDVNSTACENLGYKQDELIGKEISDVDPNFDITGFLEFWDQIHFDQQHVFETTHQRKDGSVFPVEVSGKKSMINNQPYYYGIARDITKRKQDEQALRESEARFRLIFDNVRNIAVQGYHADGTVHYWNKASEVLYGYTAAEAAGRKLFDLIIPEQMVPDVKTAVQQMFKSGVPTPAEELTLKRKDGAHVHTFSNHVLVEVPGKATELYCIDIDLTKKKQAEEKLLESTARLKTIVTNFPNGVMFMFNRQYVYTYADGKILNKFGLSTADIVDRKIDEVFPPEVSDVVFEHIPALFNGEDCYYEVVFQGHYFANWGTAVKNEDGDITEGLVYAVDITNLKEQEKAILESKDRFSALVNNLQSGVFYIDTQGNIIEANPALIKILGSPSLEATKAVNIFTFKPLIDFGYTDQLKECINNRTIVSNEGEYISKWGKKIYLKYYFVPIIQNNKVQGVLANVEDITEKKKMEKHLKESELFANAVANTTPALIYIYDVEKQQNIYTNEVHKRFFTKLGKSNDELTHYEISDLAHPDDFAKLVEKSTEMISNPDIDKYKVEIRMKHHGEWRWMLLTNSVFRKNEQGIARQVLGAMFDIDDRKHAEQSLKESETRFKALHNASFGGIAIHDKGIILDCNKGLSEITGYLFEELIGMDGLLLIAEKFRKKVMDHILAEYEEPYEAIGVRQNGEEYPLRLEAKMIPYKGKKARVVEFRDITEQKKIEGELVKAKEQAETISMNLNAALESMSDAVFISDTTGKFINFNEAFATFHKFKSKEQCVRTLVEYPIFLDVFYPDGEFVPVDKWAVNRALNGEYGINEEFHLKRKDTGETWIGTYNFGPVLDSDGQIIGSVVTARDITDKKKAELELLKAKELAEESEAKLVEAQELSHVGSFEYFVNTDTVIWSKELYNIFQLPHNLPAPKYSEQSPLYTAESFTKLDQAVQNCIQYGTPYEIELEIFTSGGSRKQIISKGKAIRDEDDKIIGCYGTALDITTRKKLETDLIKAKERAEEADRLKSAFLANMSHEIRTPMSGIMGFTELLKEPDLTGEEKEMYLEVIRKSGERMLNTVNDIIDISKIDSGQMEVKIDVVNLDREINSLYTFFKNEAENKGLNLKLINRLTDESQLILTDRNKLNSILTNLIKNAIKYTHQGYIEIECLRAGDYLLFQVKDTGIGIPKNRIDAIFNRFEQADIADRQAYQGSGLGLSITKSYVEMLDGKIWVESEEDKGSVFSVSLPWKAAVKDKKPTAQKADEKPDQTKPAKLRIIVVEDDETSLQHLNIILEPLASEIINVTSGTKAVEAIKQNPDTDLILMDIKLPGMDGYTATKKIREFNRKVIIIAQTAYALLGDREKALGAGCNDYITKPIKKPELNTMIRKFFKQL